MTDVENGSSVLASPIGLHVKAFGQLSIRPASVTVLRAHGNVVLGAGLCGRLKAWERHGTEWKLVLDETSIVSLANRRATSHAYQFVTTIRSDGLVAVATNGMDQPVQVWCTRQWLKLQDLGLSGDAEVGGGFRWSASCLHLEGAYLAYGSRSGHVALWKESTEHTRTFLRCWGGLNRKTDQGPVGAVTVTADFQLVIAAHRQSRGSVDGVAFIGDQAIAAWRVDTGELAWRLPQHGLCSPLQLLCLPGSQVWSLHAHAAHVDAGWHWLRAASSVDLGGSGSGGTSSGHLRGGGGDGSGGGSGSGGDTGTLGRAVEDDKGAGTSLRQVGLLADSSSMAPQSST